MKTNKDIVRALLEKKILVTSSLLQKLECKEKVWLDKFSCIIREKLPDDIYNFINTNTEENISFVFNYKSKIVNKTINDFVSYFNTRYKAIEQMLRNRPEMQRVTSIKRLNQIDEREIISIIGIVKDVEETRKHNIIITLEDPTGQIKIVVNNTKQDLFTEAKTIVYDEIIGVVGSLGKGIIFVNKILWPDVPVYNELKKASVEEYAVFLSDLHVGSKKFLQSDFEKFLKWVCMEVGNEKQKNIVSKLKYIFIVGDMVDGIGVYPGQEYDLSIKNIKEQYDECARLLSQIPKHIKIIVSPGNHDAMRLAEPQLPLYEDYAAALYSIPNVIMVSNPAIINIGKREDFPGFDVLLYHGYSFDYYIAAVDEIRNNGGYDRADLVMKFMLKRRHLAPTHASCLYIPFPDDDPLIIKKVPDIFATGHLHKVSVSHYRNITLIGASCWQGKTSFQEKMGHHPEPSRVPLVNLKTREVKILKFGEE